jgi:hypothetical protein
MGAGRQRRRHGGAISERRHRGSAQGDGGGENARSASNAVTSNARAYQRKRCVARAFLACARGSAARINAGA